MEHVDTSPVVLMRLCPSETVRAARMLISSPMLWTQRARARTAQGLHCSPHDPGACHWSMNGAIAVVSNRYGITPKWLLASLDSLVVDLGLAHRLFPEPGYVVPSSYPTIYTTCDDFNDERSHTDIMDFMDAAVAWLKEYGY